MRNILEKLDGIAHTAVAQAGSLDEEAWRERLVVIDGIKNAKGRIPRQIIYRAARLAPDLGRRMIEAKYARQGLQVVGFGMSSIAILDGDKVLKVIRGSEQWNPEQQDYAVRAYQREQEMLMYYVGDTALRQTIGVIANPLDSDSVVVAMAQDFVSDF